MHSHAHDKITIKGKFWSADDNVFVDYQNGDGGWTCLCLNEFMKRNIPENHIVKIEITVKDPDTWRGD